MNKALAYWLLLLLALLAAACASSGDDHDAPGANDDDNDDSTADDDDNDNDDNDDDDDTSNPELDAFIKQTMEQAHMPGLAAGIIRDSQIIWSNGYGWAHIAQQRPATPDTIFQLASVSKTATGVALMQLYEAGEFELDDQVNDYLAFDVANPNYAGEPITIRQLLTHSSSIRDNWLVMMPLYVAGDSPIPLGDFVEGYLSSGGEWYYANLNYYHYAPGAEWNYSNIGATLAGYLVEAITGQPFDEYCNEHLFAPLGMDETSWRLADLDKSHVAMPYQYRAASDSYEPYGYYGYPDYPDGLLRTSVNQLAHFLIAFMDYGVYDGARVLAEETVELMRQPQVPDLDPSQGLIWYYKEQTAGTLLGHNGGEEGVATEMFFRPADNVGVIVLMNGDWTAANYELLMALEDRLFAEGTAR